MKGLSALTVLLLLLLVAPTASQVPDDRLIVPGQRVGKWTLSMTIDDLLRVNGARNAPVGIAPLSRLSGPDVPDDLWVHRWLNVRLGAWTIGRESQEVVGLAISSDEYKTDKGIGPGGSSKEAVLSAYGAPTATTVPAESWWTGIYDALGVAFIVGRGNLTEVVAIFRSGAARRVFRY